MLPDSWSFHGMVEFLLSDDERAQSLRREAVFYIYPLVNPDGRYIFSRVTNPEVEAAGWPNHNRVWNTAGLLSTIDTLVPAIRFDTGGRADYLLDFHSNGTSIYSPPDLFEALFIQSMTARESDIGPARFAIAGTTQMWAMREDGLKAPYAFTLEHSPHMTKTRCLEVGRSYALAIYDVVAVRTKPEDTNPELFTDVDRIASSG